MRIPTKKHFGQYLSIRLNHFIYSYLICLKNMNTLPSADVFSGINHGWLIHTMQNHFAAQVALPSLPFRMPEKR